MLRSPAPESPVKGDIKPALIHIVNLRVNDGRSSVGFMSPFAGLYRFSCGEPGACAACRCAARDAAPQAKLCWPSRPRNSRPGIRDRIRNESPGRRFSPTHRPHRRARRRGVYRHRRTGVAGGIGAVVLSQRFSRVWIASRARPRSARFSVCYSKSGSSLRWRRSWMERAWPGMREMKPFFSSASTI